MLAAWAASPDRFREDANAEEDLVHGGYRDRLVVELAQNAADAAARAGVPGRLLLRLVGGDDTGGAGGPWTAEPAPDGGAGVLVAASTGAPLDVEGVRALASLRASAKRDTGRTVGRFGVGFAAVLAVSDAPALLTRSGGVRFSREETVEHVREAATASPGLAAEAARRGGHVPVLRLPFPASGSAPQGYDTAVLLPLRDDAAADLAHGLLDRVDDALLLALPGLAEVVVEVPGRPPRRAADAAERWALLHRSGRLDAAALAGRPTEERERTGWSLTWALPRTGASDGGGLPAGVPAVVHAPTPTDDPLPWPALLVATFPLGPDRRRVAPGPVTDALLDAAAAAYADLLEQRAATGADVLPLVPTGLPAGEVDAALRERVLARLPAARVLRTVEAGPPVRPRDAVALAGAAGGDAEALAVLAPVLAGLVAVPPRDRAALRTLGVAETDLADVVDALPADTDPGRWRDRYSGLSGLRDAAEAEALAALPVPLADGRVVRGVRGLLLPGPGLDALPPATLAALGAAGLRLVHPAATHPLLERLGARTAGPRELLEDAACRALVEDLADAADAGGAVDEALVDAVLHVVAACAGSLTAADVPWLADLPLLDDEGRPAPAGALVLPGSLAEQVLDPDEVGVLAAAVAERWPAATLAAVGVAGAPAATVARDVDLDDLPDALRDDPAARVWARDHAPGTAAEVASVAGLDVVRDDAWPQVVSALAADAGTRAALVDPVRVVPPPGAGPARDVPGPVAGWLRARLALAGCADPEATDVSAVLPAAPAWVSALPAPVRAALGLVRGWEDLDTDGWSAALAATADAGRDAPLPAVLAVWRALAAAAPTDVDLPSRLRCVTAAGAVVVLPADRVVVADAPMWAQRDDLGGLVVAPTDDAVTLADVLDLDLAGEVAEGLVAGGGVRQEVPAAARDLLPSAPRHWWRHDVLEVDGVGVGWWVDGDGTAAQVHVAATGATGDVPAAALARGLAQAVGRWDARGQVEAALAHPAAAGRLLVEDAFGPR